MGLLRLHWFVHSSKSTSSNRVVNRLGSSSGRCRRWSAKACAHARNQDMNLSIFTGLQADLLQKTAARDQASPDTPGTRLLISAAAPQWTAVRGGVGLRAVQAPLLSRFTA